MMYVTSFRTSETVHIDSPLDFLYNLVYANPLRIEDPTNYLEKPSEDRAGDSNGDWFDPCTKIVAINTNYIFNISNISNLLNQRVGSFIRKFKAGHKQAFLVVVFAQDFVIAQIKFVANAESSKLYNI